MKATNITREDYSKNFNGKTGFEAKSFTNRISGTQSAKYFYNGVEFNAFYNDNKSSEVVLMNRAWSSLSNKFYYREVARVAK